MTQDAEIRVKEQGAWLQINVGNADEPKLLRLKCIPADFDDLNRINSKIIEAGKPIKGKEASFNAEMFSSEITKGVAQYVVDWNLHDDDGKIEPTEENKVKQLRRFLIAYVTPEAAPGDIIDGGRPDEDARQTVLTLIMKFIGDYSNFLEA